MNDGSPPDRWRILVVDDQASIRHGLQIRLDTEPDLQVIGTAATGAQAIGLVRELRPDLILMDARLPTMDGFDTTAAIRTAYPMIPIVLLTLYDDASARQKARAAGAAAFVSKHDGVDALLQALRRQLGESALGSTPTRHASPQATCHDRPASDVDTSQGMDRRCLDATDGSDAAADGNDECTSSFRRRQVGMFGCWQERW